jgi:exopolyphosphatase/guanosine-5'-triphosphate,3'-diphosphate pyrophosphatase
MNVAILDLGTNTFNLLVKNIQSGEVLLNTKIAVKLGEGGIDVNTITPAAFARGIDALKAHQKSIATYHVDATYAFATSAIRTAANGQDFVLAAKREAGVTVNVISGEQEAELIYYGVQQAVNLSENCSLIVDIGGGSTEFILCNAGEIFWKESYLLGSSRLKEHFKLGDPISTEEIQRMEAYLTAELTGLFEAVNTYKPVELIGSSGSFDTLASMIFAHFDQENPLLQGHANYTFARSEYHLIAQKMLRSTFEERLNTPGMLPMRADLMPMACILINFLLNHIEVKALKLSTYALKEGVSALLNKNEHTWLKS